MRILLSFEFNNSSMVKKEREGENCLKVLLKMDMAMETSGDISVYFDPPHFFED